MFCKQSLSRLLVTGHLHNCLDRCPLCEWYLWLVLGCLMSSFFSFCLLQYYSQVQCYSIWTYHRLIQDFKLGIEGQVNLDKKNFECRICKKKSRFQGHMPNTAFLGSCAFKYLTYVEEPLQVKCSLKKNYFVCRYYVGLHEFLHISAPIKTSIFSVKQWNSKENHNFFQITDKIST